MNTRVLIVEDDKNLAESLKNIFAKKNITAKVCHSAAAAEQFISLEQYDLLIVDLILPKVNGVEFLKKAVSHKLLHSECTVWVISGVLSPQIIPRDLKNHIDDFIRKPLDLPSIQKKADDLFKETSSKLLKNIPFFYTEREYKDIQFLGKKQYTIKGHELMFICFYLCSIRFNGLMKISYYGAEQPEEILFVKGTISNFKSENKGSYLGTLLIKHNLISQKNLDALLKEKSNLPLGERLVASCYVSPHNLNKVLTEQLAIRLFEVMGHSSLIINCVDFIPSREFTYFVSLQQKDLLSLVKNWIQSKVSTEWLSEFFENYKNMQVQFIKKLPNAKRLSHYPGMEFLSAPALEGSPFVSEIIKDFKNKKNLRELYCRLLVKEVHLQHSQSNIKNKGKDKDEFLKNKYLRFLKESKTKNYFELMNLPLNASVDQIETVYRNLVKIFHPDRRNQDISEELAKICDQCFLIVSKMYQILSDSKEKQKYIDQIKEKTKASGLSIKKQYTEGKRQLMDGSFGPALEQFESIMPSGMAPGDTLLFYIWAKIKKENAPLSKEDVKKVRNTFNKVGLEYKQTATFFFVKGLVLNQENNKREAFQCFKKALMLEPTLKVARVEQYALSASTKSSKKSGRGKSSFMDLFKKGA